MVVRETCPACGANRYKKNGCHFQKLSDRFQNYYLSLVPVVNGCIGNGKRNLRYLYGATVLPCVIFSNKCVESSTLCGAYLP
jgi:hypothetical protein